MKYIAVLDSDDKLSEEAIDSIKNTVFCGDEQAPYFFDVDSVEEITDQIHKKGKWAIKATGFPPEPITVCSECGFDRDYYIFPRGCHKMKYCPNCGAEMENK